MRRIVFLLLLFQPLVNKLTLKFGLPFDVYNELISLVVFLLYLLQVVHKRKVTSAFFLIASFVSYMFLGVLIKGLYPASFLQIAIYSQWFFYFLYYHTLEDITKHSVLISIKKLFDIVLVGLIVFSVFEIVFFSEYREFLGVKDFNRGLNGFYLISIFGSGASLANFMSFYILLWFYYHFGLNHIVANKDKIKLGIAFLFLVFSFSRKEVLFMFLFLLFFPFNYRSLLKKWIKKAVAFLGIFSGLFIYYLVFFSEANKVAFGDRYIRWRIAKKSWSILLDNLPFGTGVGTFGSRVSLMNTEIYEAYDIGPEMLGYKSLGQIRGPIYDAFLFTFTTELGLGIFLFLFFFFKLFNTRALKSNRSKEYIKNYLILFLVGLSFFQPVLISSFGFLCAIFLGLTMGGMPLTKFRTYVKN